MTPSTKTIALKSMQLRASSLRDIIDSHLKGDAQRAYEAWREHQSQEAREAERELEGLEKAILELEQM